MDNVCEALSKRRQQMAPVAVFYDRDRHCLKFAQRWRCLSGVRYIG